MAITSEDNKETEKQENSSGGAPKEKIRYPERLNAVITHVTDENPVRTKKKTYINMNEK